MTFNGESRTRVVRPRSDAWNVRGSSSSGGQGGSRWKPPPSSAALTFPSNAVAADRHFPLCCYPSVVVLMRSHVLLLSCHLLPNLLPYSYQKQPVEPSLYKHFPPNCCTCANLWKTLCVWYGDDVDCRRRTRTPCSKLHVSTM